MSLPGFTFNITGASGATGLLGPKNSYRCYVFPRGGYAAQDSTGSKITFDSASVASRFAVGNWIQSGLLTTNIRQVGAVGGNSLTISGAALTVTTNDRIYLIGNTEPTVNGGSATYTTPNTIVRQRDDDAATVYANSMLITNTDGMVQGFAVTALYDLLIQDSNGANQGSLIDLPVGVPEGISVTDWAFFGASVTVHGAIGVTDKATFANSVTITGNLGISQTIFLRSAVLNGDGVLDQSLYSDMTRDLSAATSGQAYLSADIKTRFGNTTSLTNLSLNGLFSKNQYGVAGVGGGDVQTGIATGSYSEHRGNAAITGALYGAENSTTMYNTGSIATAFGSLNTAQITSGASGTITLAEGVAGYARIQGTGKGVITTAIGVNGLAGFQDTSSGTITDAIGGRFAVTKEPVSGATITNASGIQVLTVSQGSVNNFGVRVIGCTGGSNLNQSLRIDSGESTFLGIVTFAGTSNSNLVQSATLALPEGCFFGISGTLGAGTSISQITPLQTGREIILWSAAGTMGFSSSSNLRVVGASFNVPQNSAVKCFCVGNTWFVFSPSS